MAIKKRPNFEGFYIILKNLVILAIVGYGVWTVGNSINRNYQTNQVIDNLKREIVQIQADIVELNNLILYYKTNSFKEIEIRRRLGLKAEGEEVIILPKKEQQSNTSQTSAKQSPDQSSEMQTGPSNIEKWWRFIFYSS